MDWTEWADWFCYGKWEKSGLIGRQVQWRFDKERIRHELATNLYRYRYCPNMNTSLAEAVIRHLPDTVSPETDSNWAFNEKYEEVPGAIKVKQKDKSDGFTYTQEFWSDGVRPKGLKVFADILIKAFKDIGMPASTTTALLK